MTLILNLIGKIFYVDNSSIDHCVLLKKGCITYAPPFTEVNSSNKKSLQIYFFKQECFYF